MIPSKPTVISAISTDEEAEMDKLTAPEDAEMKNAAVDEFIAGLDHEQLQYAANKIRDALGAEGELEEDVDAPPIPEESGSTKNVEE